MILRNLFSEVLSHMMINYEKILLPIKKRLSDAKILVMAFSPVCTAGKENELAFINRNNQNHPMANQAVRELAEKLGYCYIDVNGRLTDENEMLKEESTIDGIHMYTGSYRIARNNIKPYLYALRYPLLLLKAKTVVQKIRLSAGISISNT